MNASFSDSESTDSEPPSFVEGWHILAESEWGVALGALKFRHPRVLLAYFRFITLHNEIAAQEEYIEIPKIPRRVMDFMFSHCSFTNIPPEFKNEVDSLKFYIRLFGEL